MELAKITLNIQIKRGPINPFFSLEKFAIKNNFTPQLVLRRGGCFLPPATDL
jgi:hypothetical protein